MTTLSKVDKSHALFTNLCINFAGSIRALSLYPPDHPETQKKMGHLLQGLTQYLQEKPNLTLVFFKGEVVIENTPLPELTDKLAKLIKSLESMKLQRIVFRRGVSAKEILLLFQLLLPLLKNPSGAEEAVEKHQENLPHIVVGSLPMDSDLEVSYEDLSGAPQASRQSVLSFADQLKVLFADLGQPLSETKVSAAKETTEGIYAMNMSRELPLKVLIYRRSPDPDPHIHAINVAALTMALSKRLDLDEAKILDLGLAALLHDIGLHVSVPGGISEGSATTPDEKRPQLEHPLRGAEILMATRGMPDLAPVVAYEHHLHYDGGGYPRQKRPRDLNVASMITTIADTYDNLRCEYASRRALTLSEALNWMDQKAGTLFHPILLKRFRGLVRDQAKEGV